MPPVKLRGKSRLVIKLETGPIILSSRELLPIGKIRAKRNIKPSLSKPAHSWAFFSGKSPSTTLNPSKGLIGNKLKIPRTIFIFIKKTKTTRLIVRKNCSLNNMNNLSIIESNIAKIKFDAGPAKEIQRVSFLGFFKLKESIGTGFPQPKPKRSKKTIPKVSI